MSDRSDLFPHRQKAKLTRTSWAYAWARTIQRFSDDRRMDSAATLSYYFLLSVIPALGAGISMLTVFGQGPTTVESILNVFEQVTGWSRLQSLYDPLMSMARSSANLPVFIGGIILSLWSAGRYVRTFGLMVNEVFEVAEGRTWWVLRFQSFLVTLLLIPLIIAIFGLLTGRTDWLEFFNLPDFALFTWKIARFPLIVLFMFFTIAVLGAWTSNVKRPQRNPLTVGAGVALVAWLLLTAGVYFFVITVGFASAYGALSIPFVLLTWLWLTNLALVFGIQFDCEMLRARRLQSGIPAESDILLPPKATGRIIGVERREFMLSYLGAQLRRSEGRTVGKVEYASFLADPTLRRLKKLRLRFGSGRSRD